MKKTLVIGASENPARYSNKAINSLLDKGHEVLAIGNGKGKVAGVDYSSEKTMFANVDTVTLYINPKIQENYLDYIINLKPARLIFNPGTENEKLYNLAKVHGIEVLEACTLVMLATNQY
jgi:predicted CoA-binding protein